MSDRFFVQNPITTDPTNRVTLDGPEAHHLLHVMRATVGTQVTLFDDTDCEFAAVVESVRRADAQLRIIERRETSRELPFELVVGVALPKGDRQKWLVEKLTELGVTTLVPLVAERGVAQPTAGAIDRLSRSVVEAAKQCGRNRLMQITEPQKWEAYISEYSGDAHASARRIVAHPGGVPLRSIDFKAGLPTYAAIGPEGGLTNAEVSIATNAGWQNVSLGSSILRVETAAIACAAAAALLSCDAK